MRAFMTFLLQWFAALAGLVVTQPLLARTDRTSFLFATLFVGLAGFMTALMFQQRVTFGRIVADFLLATLALWLVPVFFPGFVPTWGGILIAAAAYTIVSSLLQRTARRLLLSRNIGNRQDQD